MYLFQVLSLLHWISEFSKDEDYNVFQPSLPSDLTHQGASVIYLNGTSPSECQHPSCWHTKGHLWIEVFPKHYRLTYYIIHSSSIQLITLPFYYVDLYSRLSFYATRESFASVPYSKSQIDVLAGCPCSKSQIIRGLSFYTPANMSLNS